MRLSVTWLTVFVSACRHLAAGGQLRAREISVPILTGICAGICPGGAAMAGTMLFTAAGWTVT